MTARNHRRDRARARRRVGRTIIGGGNHWADWLLSARPRKPSPAEMNVGMRLWTAIVDPNFGTAPKARRVHERQARIRRARQRRRDR